MKIGIFGGTFDPFTEAHMEIVKTALNIVDEVHIIPSVVDYYRKDKECWLTHDIRAIVIQKFINHFENNTNIKGRVFFNDFEYDFAKENAPSVIKKRRFIDTLNQFIYDFPCEPCEFYTIIGTDSYKNFKTWTDWEEILKLSKLIVVNGRDGEIVENDIPKIDLEIDSKYLNVSSTKIREQYKDKNYEQYVADVLSNHIIESTYLSTPIFDVVKKTVSGLDFKPVGINSKDWVTIIVEWNGKFIMVKQLRYGLMEEKLEFPCGMVENGEEPLSAAKRELQEETGIELLDDSQIKYFGKCAANPAFMNNYMHYYYVNLDTAEFVQGDTNFDEHEKITRHAVDKNEVIDEMLKMDNRNSVFMLTATYKYLEFKNNPIWMS